MLQRAYKFSPKDPRDTDGLVFDLSAWDPDDPVTGTPTADATPTGLTIGNVVLDGTDITVWASDGQDGTTYRVTVHFTTASGRDVHLSALLPVCTR